MGLGIGGLDQDKSGLASANSILRLEIWRIENKVLMGACHGLNWWFIALRSGRGTKAVRAALQRYASSVAVGHGLLGLGGKIQSYVWRAKNANNLISRVSQKGKVA